MRIIITCRKYKNQRGINKNDNNDIKLSRISESIQKKNKKTQDHSMVEMGEQRRQQTLTLTHLSTPTSTWLSYKQQSLVCLSLSSVATATFSLNPACFLFYQKTVDKPHTSLLFISFNNNTQRTTVSTKQRLLMHGIHRTLFSLLLRHPPPHPPPILSLMTIKIIRCLWYHWQACQVLSYHFWFYQSTSRTGSCGRS